MNLADQPSRYRGLCFLILLRLRFPTSIQGLDALMNAIQKWDGGVVIISHDERFITTVANEVNIFMGYIVQSDSVCSFGYVEIKLLADLKATSKLTRRVYH